MNIIWKVQKQGVPLKFWALENPRGYLYNFLGYPTLTYQPWQFGELGALAAKRTGIWGYFNKPKFIVLMRPELFVPKRKKGKTNYWGCLTPKKRAITPTGFAQAFFKANK